MTYEEYVNLTLEKIGKGELPEDFKVLSEKEYEEWIKPIPPTPPLSEDMGFQLAYEIAYKRIRKILENSDLADKEEKIKQLDEDFLGAAKNLNML